MLRDTISTIWGLGNVPIRCVIQIVTFLRINGAPLQRSFLRHNIRM